MIAQLDRSREIFAALHIPIYDAPGFEADDVIGTLAKLLKSDFNIIIASGDMDTLQLVDGTAVQVYTLKKGINDTVTYDEDTVKERYGFGPAHIADYKGLRGDPSDNIIGVPGIGEKTATTLITTFGGIDDIYKALKNTEKFKEKSGLTDRIVKLLEEHEEEAEFSKVLATIRTDAPVTFNKDDASLADFGRIGRRRAVYQARIQVVDTEGSIAHRRISSKLCLHEAAGSYRCVGAWTRYALRTRSAEYP